MRELVVASKCHLQCKTKSLDEHDGNGASSGTDRKVDEWVLLAIAWSNLIYHNDRKDSDEATIEEKAYIKDTLVGIQA